MCGICVDVCNFDAIEMSHEHELSKYVRNGNRSRPARQLLAMGMRYQETTAWHTKQPEKNSGVAAPPKEPDRKAGTIELAQVPREAVERRKAVMRARVEERFRNQQ